MSPPVGDNVIVFKSVCESDNLEEDAYYEAFRSVGYNVTLIPVLDFEFINLNQLLRMIKASNKYSGICYYYLNVRLTCSKTFQLKYFLLVIINLI